MKTLKNIWNIQGMISWLTMQMSVLDGDLIVISVFLYYLSLYLYQSLSLFVHSSVFIFYLSLPYFSELLHISLYLYIIISLSIYILYTGIDMPHGMYFQMWYEWKITYGQWWDQPIALFSINNISSLVQDCSTSSAFAMEILQYCIKAIDI